MGLEDRVKDEMYINTESILEEEFDRAKELYDLYGDNTVAVADEYESIEPKETVLIHLIAWQYISEVDAEASSGLSYDYFYDRIDAGDSTIRGYFSDFSDENLVRENEEGNKTLVVERLSDVIDRIQSNVEDD